MTQNGFSEGRIAENASLRVAIRPLIRLVFLWMGFGLLVTGFVSVVTAGSELLQALLANELALYTVFFVELLLVAVLSTRIQRMSFGGAAITFTIYATLNGLTLGAVILNFDLGSVLSAFATCAALFIVMAVIGFTTEIDLSGYGVYFAMGLIGLVIALLVNFILGSRTLELLISVVGVVLFTGLTAYDIQKIKKLAADPEIGSSLDLTLKLSIMGALILYLDFINLFLYVLNLSGDSDS